MITDFNVLDNFYSDPDAVVKKLNGDYPIIGCGTGSRSIGLRDIDENLYLGFCDGLFNIHGISSKGLAVDTFFMEHSRNENEIFNHGWTHIDGKNPDVCRMTTETYDIVCAGVIFLTPQPDMGAGITISKLKPSVDWTQEELFIKTIDEYTIPRENFEAGKISLEEYTKLHKEYHDNFYDVAYAGNIYNRMVSWRGMTLHGHKLATMNKRLNQYFFIYKAS